MDDLTTPSGMLPTSHATPAAGARFAREAEQIDEARADVAAGRVFTESDVDAWIDSLGTDHELPAPGTRR